MIPRGYIKVRRDAFGYGLRDRIKKLLTVVPVASSSFSQDEVIMRLWQDDGDYIGVPRGFYNMRLRGKYVDECEFDYSVGSNPLQKAEPITPREGQGDLIDKAVNCLNALPFGGCVIEAQPAAGKTVLGLEIARRIGLKLLVIVHISTLIDQWEKEIQKFFPHWRIGILQADKIDIENKDIVIGMLQSCSMKDYPEHVYEAFGTIIVDEVHVAGAPEFSKVLDRFAPKYFMGLSGSVARKDRAEKVFIYGIGPVISGMEEIKVIDPIIYFIDTGFVWWGDDGGALDRQKPSFLRDLITSEKRNEMIIRQTLKALDANRNILIISERISHAEDLASKLRLRTNKNIGLMIGESTKAERRIAQTADVIVATYKLLGTGFNEPRLDTLIYATPIQDTVQPPGRIRREFPGKKQPLVLDLVDSNSHIGLVYGQARRKRYEAKGWETHGTQVFEKLKRKNK